MAASVDQIIARKNELSAERDIFKSLWQEIADYTLPNKSDFLRIYGKGMKRRPYIYDSTAEHSLDIFSSSLLALLCNPASRWFTFSTIKPELNSNHAVQQWLDIAGLTVLNCINQAQAKFYGHMKSALKDIGAFGTTGVFTQEGLDTFIEFMSYDPGKLCIAENASGNVDTVYIERDMTAYQLAGNARDRGWEVDKTIIDDAEKRPQKTYQVIHAIYPRDGYAEGSINKQDLPWASCFVDVQNKKIMFEGGYHEMPIAVARWDKVSQETYGRSPGMVALSDVKMLNASEKAMIIAMEKFINPPIILPWDSSYGLLDLSPGAQNFGDMSKGKLEMIQSNGPLPMAFDWQEGKRNSIRIAFYVDQLQLVGTQTMTATEVLQRQDEKARLLTPAIGRIQSELISPLIERCLAILVRNGTIARPPEELAKADVKAIYVSQVTRAQRAAEAMGIMEFTQRAAAIGQVNPEALDKINWDSVITEFHDIGGLPASILYEDEQVAAMREQRQQQQQMQQMAAMAQQGADIAETASKAGVM